MKEQPLSVEAAFNLMRTDKQLGRGSCSHVDEAMTDAELLEELEELESEWGDKFVWWRVREYYYGLEKNLWASTGIHWPPRS